jgi:hypothetical protein
MDDNTTRVVLTVVVLAFVVVTVRWFDRVSLRIERLRFNIFGLLKVRAGVLMVAMRRRQGSKRCRTNLSSGIARAAPFIQGRFASSSAIRVVLGDCDINMFVVTHPDDDHVNGLLDIFQCPHHGHGR